MPSRAVAWHEHRHPARLQMAGDGFPQLPDCLRSLPESDGFDPRPAKVGRLARLVRRPLGHQPEQAAAGERPLQRLERTNRQTVRDHDGTLVRKVVESVDGALAH